MNDIRYYFIRVTSLSGDYIKVVGDYHSLEEVFERLVYIVSETSDYVSDPCARVEIIGRNDRYRDVYKHSFLVDLCP